MLNDRMRVGVNAAFLGKSHNGQNTYVRGLIKAFEKYGSASEEEYVIYTSAQGDVPSSPNFEWRRSPHWASHDAERFGNVGRVLWTQFILPTLLLKDGIDILLCPLADAPIVARTPRVVVVHDLIPLFYPQESPRLALYFRFVVPLFLRNARRIMADSEHTKRDLVRAYGIGADQITVVSLGVDDCYFSDNCRCDAPAYCPDKYFLFVGACLPRKNPLDVIRAFARVQSNLDEKLVLVTSVSGHLRELEGVVKELGLADRLVVYTGLPQQQMLFLYRHATALIFLSEYEGFGYPAAEALASGSPAIVCDGTSLPEVVGDAGVIVRSGDLQAAAKAMTELANDEILRKRLQDCGRLRSETFRWRAVVEDVRSVLLATLGNKHEGRLSHAALQR
jgi:glycosyltransferase involved in cell wall biosynthesis